MYITILFSVIFLPVLCLVLGMSALLALKFDVEFRKKTFLWIEQHACGMPIVVLAVFATLCAGMGEVMKTFVSEGRAQWVLCYYAVLAGCFWGGLMFACITDLIMCEVYDLCWIISVPSAMGLWVGMPVDLWMALGVCFFIFLQLAFFSKLYGKADGYAFCACAVFEGGVGMGMKEFFGQMILAYVFLILAQIMGKNIKRNGNLVKPVPFLPYIILAFFVNILQFQNKF